MIACNKEIDAIPHCRYVMDRHHDCRAAMRNNMASKGRYEWHLMVDARLSIVYADFIRRYLESGAQPGEAVCGGVMVDGGVDSSRLYRENLRFRYEKFEEKNHRPRSGTGFRTFLSAPQISSTTARCSVACLTTSA